MSDSIVDRTIRLALVGNPVAHSRSPAIQRAALAAAGITGDYVAIEANGTRLEEILFELRAGDIDGVNVTMPLKGQAAAQADELTRLARAASSVNTLRAHDGRIEAHSTDAVAFQEVFGAGALAGDGAVLILGSGGSARAALAALTGLSPRPIYVSARSPVRAGELADRFVTPVVVPWGAGVAGATVVNATPLGMAQEALPEAVIDAAGGLVDLPYGEKETPAVMTMTISGRPHVDGLEFLARQAAASFVWWTGRAVSLSTLIQVARNV